MKNLSILLAFLISTTVIFTGCRSPGVTQLSSDTYVISNSSAAGGFTNMAKLRARTIEEANTFAADRNKVAVPLNSREIIPRTGFPSFEYQFRLLDPDDPRAQGVSLEPRPDLVIQRSDDISADITTRDETEQGSDLYNELIRLDDLRTRGLITDKEFETEKKKLLERSR